MRGIIPFRAYKIKLRNLAAECAKGEVELPVRAGFCPAPDCCPAGALWLVATRQALAVPTSNVPANTVPLSDAPRVVADYTGCEGRSWQRARRVGRATAKRGLKLEPKAGRHVYYMEVVAGGIAAIGRRAVSNNDSHRKVSGIALSRNRDFRFFACRRGILVAVRFLPVGTVDSSGQKSEVCPSPALPQPHRKV